MGKYNWLPSNSAPKGCLMELVSGGFELEGDSMQYIPAAVLHGGWGESDSLHVVGDEYKALPKSFAVLFYSYLEDKFYRGNFELPTQRIRELFAKGYRTTRGVPGEHNTFDTIVAGVAPGGTVAVWLEGVGRTQEVFFGKATRDDSVDWHRAMRLPPNNDRQEVIEEMLQSANDQGQDPLVPIRRQHLDLDLWTRYRNSYRWTPVFELSGSVATMEVKSLNGDQEDLFFPLDARSAQEPRTLPLSVNIRLPAHGYQVDGKFDDQETMQVAEKLGIAGTPIEIVFRELPSTGHRSLRAFMRNEHEEVELSKATLESFMLKKP